MLESCAVPEWSVGAEGCRWGLYIIFHDLIAPPFTFLCASVPLKWGALSPYGMTVYVRAEPPRKYWTLLCASDCSAITLSHVGAFTLSC